MENVYDILNDVGVSFLRDGIDISLIDELSNALDESLIKHREIQISNNNDIEVKGVALNLLADDPVYLKLLQKLIDLNIINDIEKKFFNSKFILNSFSGLNNLPSKSNFSSQIHRDSKFFANETPLMLNMLIMLDDFTEENGPTLLLPYSHKELKKPTNKEFNNNAIKAIGKRGDILFFNADIWHASSLNRSTKGRRALPLTFSKSFIKQLMDYPRCLGYDKINEFNDDLLRLIGYYSRVPANLNEWYAPIGDRFYKKNED